MKIKPISHVYDYKTSYGFIHNFFYHKGRRYTREEWEAEQKRRIKNAAGNRYFK